MESRGGVTHTVSPARTGCPEEEGLGRVLHEQAGPEQSREGRAGSEEQPMQREAGQRADLGVGGGGHLHVFEREATTPPPKGAHPSPGTEDRSPEQWRQSSETTC